MMLFNRMLFIDSTINEKQLRMHNTYKNPPVIEAVCEFKFTPEQPVDITVIGLFYDKIRGEFPNKQQQTGVASRVEEGAFGFEIQQRVQFSRANHSAAVGASPDILTIHQLKPYTTWHDFKSLILRNFEIFKELIEPKSIKRVGLRYINRFDFNESQIERLEDNFNFYPAVPRDLPKIYAAISDHVEMPFEDGRDRLRIRLLSITSEKPNIFSFTLDFDYFAETAESAEDPFDSIESWIENAHEQIEDAFEKCITEKCRARFRGTS
jgi:uncharacterized protein (TIGR04255 family)